MGPQTKLLIAADCQGRFRGALSTKLPDLSMSPLPPQKEAEVEQKHSCRDGARRQEKKIVRKRDEEKGEARTEWRENRDDLRSAARLLFGGQGLVQQSRKLITKQGKEGQAPSARRWADTSGSPFPS